MAKSLKALSMLDVADPATGQKIASLAQATDKDVLAVIAAAKMAQKPWAEMLAHERGAVLRRWYDKIVENKQHLAEVLTRENGKPLAESLAEIDYAAGFVSFYAEEATRIMGRVQPPFIKNSRVLVTRQPVGVCVAITPWNFPSSMITRKVAPALAAGCTVILKPAEQTPLSAIELYKLGLEAGLPQGVFQLVLADGKRSIEVGKTLTTHPDIRKISFTGSTEVGKILMAQAAGTVKAVSFELGGNAPVLIFDDCDLEVAVKAVMAVKFRNCGQTCISANRIFVQKGIYKRFVTRLKAEVAALKVGSGFEPRVQIGPLINKEAVVKVEKLVKDAKAKGAKIACGGKPHKAGALFYTPTVLEGMKPNMAAFGQEIFGPVAAIYPFSSEDEVVAAANHTAYGLASYLFTKDAARIFRVSEALQYGMVGVNAVAISHPSIPFGGVKESGFGREGGAEGLEAYLTTKYTLLAGV